MKRLLLISGYDASSHKYWRELLVEQLPEYDWTQIALPDRYFYWRARGNAMSIAYQHQEVLSQDYDLLIVTSMVDLTALRGFCPHLADIPSIIYFHENQFAYPVEESANLVNIQLLSIYSALSADKVVFNSEYNRVSYLNGVEQLLTRLPDQIPKGLVKQIIAKSSVLAVPLAVDVQIMRRETTLGKPIQIVWNHRWEFDKQPEVFFKALERLKAAGIEFQLHLLGQTFRKMPEVFEKAQKQFSSEIVTTGYQTRAKYIQILSQADIVVSSSAHEFQGISMLEGIALGCMPVAPDRLVYNEYIPDELRYPCADDTQLESLSLAEKLEVLINANCRIIPDVSDYLCANAVQGYQDLISEMLTKQT